MKKKKITLLVTLEFSGKATEDAVIHNIVASLQHTANTAGIVDDADERYTKKINVVNLKGDGYKLDFEKNFGQDIVKVKSKKK
jgi:hypothetical protein